jgi:hypothetical protein
MGAITSSSDHLVGLVGLVSAMPYRPTRNPRQSQLQLAENDNVDCGYKGGTISHYYLHF